MKKWIWLLLILSCWMAAGFVIFGTGHNKNPDTTPPPNRIERIVSLAPNLTEILFSLGLEKELVGVTLNCNYPPQASEKPKVGTFWQLDIESIISLRPDLVVTLDFEQQQNIAQRLERIGSNCLTLKIEKVNHLFEAIDAIGKTTGKIQQAEELIRGIKENIDKLTSRLGSRKKVRVLWVVQREPLRVAGRDTFINEMIELAGGENAIDPTIHVYPPIGSEEVLACLADVIIEPAMDVKDLKKQQDTAFEYWSRYESLPAVTDRRIYVINGDLVSRLGPRLYEGIEIIARCLRPELFTD